MVKNKKNRSRAIDHLAVVLVAALLTFLLKDVVSVFSVSFLPMGELKIKTVEQENGYGENVTIVKEGLPHELFDAMWDKLEADGQPEETDWVMTEGQAGVVWTSLATSESGKEISVNVAKDPKGFFTVFRNQWGKALEYSTDEGKVETINCYSDEYGLDTELVRVFPFADSVFMRRNQWISYIVAFLIFFALIQLLLFGYRRG